MLRFVGCVRLILKSEVICLFLFFTSARTVLIFLLFRCGLFGVVGWFILNI